MHFILLFSVVFGLNFADSIYSATFFLSKTANIYPLFPLVDEIAFYNQDKTIDYSTLIDGAKSKYDAINAYETLLYMNIPDVMTDEQKGNLTKSIYFIKDVDSQEMGSYCRTVYERIYVKYGTYLNLEPLNGSPSDAVDASVVADSLKSEIINEKRSDISDDIMADDIVDRYTLLNDLKPEFAKSFLESFNATLFAFRTIAKVHGIDIFLPSDTAAPIFTSNASDINIAEVNGGTSKQQNELILEKRDENDLALKNYQKAVENFPLIFKENSKLNSIIQAFSTASVTYFQVDRFQLLAMVATSIDSADYHNIGGTIKVHPAFKQELIQISTGESLEKALMVYFNFEFAVDFTGILLNNNLDKEKSFLAMAHEYSNDPLKRIDSAEQNIRTALKISENLDILLEYDLDGIFGIKNGLSKNRRKGKGPTSFLLDRLAIEFKKGREADIEAITKNIGVLNKMSYVTFENELDFEVDGLQMVQFKITWRNLWSKKAEIMERARNSGVDADFLENSDLSEHLHKLITPIDHLQNQINTLVSNPNFIAEYGEYFEDPLDFFRTNQMALRRAAAIPEINNILRNIVHSLSNTTIKGITAEDVSVISDILIGDGVDDHGVIGYSRNTVFTSTARKLRNLQTAKDYYVLKTRVSVTIKRN